MTDSMLNAIFKRAGAEQKDNKATMPDGSSITLYASHAGVSLSASNIIEVEREGGLLYATNKKSEQFVLAQEDVFAASITGSDKDSRGGRKAGFLSK